MASDPKAAADEVAPAAGVTRGVCRLLGEHGYAVLTEFTLRIGKRVDVIALGPRGELLIVEVKSSPADFRSDAKWPQYLDHCERFYFAVPQDFPSEILPQDCGLIVADSYSAAFLRESPAHTMSPARRKSITLRFALTAARRLELLLDPPSAGQADVRPFQGRKAGTRAL